MNQEATIQKLRQLADDNEVARDLFNVWLKRQRARTVVTTSALTQNMRAEAIKHTRSEYAEVLRILSNLGIGAIIVNRRGRVIALSGIKATLQSIAECALGHSKQLKFRPGLTRILPYITPDKKPMPIFTLRKPETVNIKAKPTTPPPAPTTPVNVNKIWRGPTAENSIVIGFPLGDKLINVPVPKDFSNEDIANLVKWFQEKGKAQ